MSDRIRQHVTDYLLDALDDAESRAVAARLKTDPQYQEAYRLVRLQFNCLQRLECDPPPRLSERTTEYVFDHPRRVRAALARPRPITSRPVPRQATSRLSWADAGVAAAILLIAALLILPAIFGARFQARITGCQDHLRQMGQALDQYSHRHAEVFPPVPAHGNLAVAGVYAPTLLEDGYLTEPRCLLCPDSPQAQLPDFHVPSLKEVVKADGSDVLRLQQQMGGSYGYCLGYVEDGVVRPTRNLGRETFAIMADAPSLSQPGFKSSNHGLLGQNVLFEDLHVDFLRTTRPGDGRDDIYLNDNLLVAAGLHRNDSVIAASGTGPIPFVGLQ